MAMRSKTDAAKQHRAAADSTKTRERQPSVAPEPKVSMNSGARVSAAEIGLPARTKRRRPGRKEESHALTEIPKVEIPKMEFTRPKGGRRAGDDAGKAVTITPLPRLPDRFPKPRTMLHVADDELPPAKDEELRKRVSYRLRAARYAYEENQTAMAERLGISNDRLSKAETGKTVPDPEIIIKFCLLTKVPADWIFLGTIDERMPKDIVSRMGLMFDDVLDLKEALAGEAS